jgi:hypothetical protein
MSNDKNPDAQFYAEEDGWQPGNPNPVLDWLHQNFFKAFLVIILLSGAITLLYAGTNINHGQSRAAKDRSNIGGIAKALVLYADDHNGVFPHETTPVLSMKKLVDEGFIPDPKIFECRNMPSLTPQQLQESATKGNGILHNQYYYNWANKLTTDTDITFSVGNAPKAWSDESRPFAIVGKCDGTTMDLELSRDPSRAKKVVYLVNPACPADRIYFQDFHLSGSTVDTWLQPASTTTTWFK